MAQHFNRLRIYKQFGADVGFECACGNRRVVLIRDVMKAYPPHMDPNRIARKMRCSVCGQKAVTAHPVLSDVVLSEPPGFKAHWSFGLGDKD
jgi:hypothetical protein